MSTKDDTSLREKIHELMQSFGPNQQVLDQIMCLIAEEVRGARIAELEGLKQYCGAYIGIGGRRVDNMLHHDVIDARLAELSTPAHIDRGPGFTHSDRELCAYLEDGAKEDML